MAIRFILEVPRSEAQGALDVIERVSDAEPLTAHLLDDPQVGRAVCEILVTAESLDIIDALYPWHDALQDGPSVYVTVPDGERYRMDAYDAPSLRHALEAHLSIESAPPPAPPVQYAGSRAGNLVYEVPFGGRMSDGPALVLVDSTLKLERFDHIALRVPDLARSERFYHTFFGMDIVYRAYREDGRWEQLDETFSWSESIQTGVYPEIVRLENGPVALVLIDVGLAHPIYENRIDHVSVVVSPEVLAQIRGKALFHSFAVREDGQRAFQFIDPFGLVWQLIADEGAAIEAGRHGT
jgi:catechol 2,3-dioxygenase-like lactoylglutathione lyase family enzyme